MNTLRQAVQEYLSLRRSLGFKLHDAGKGLLDFVTFMEQRRATYITQTLALAWGATTDLRSRICASSQRHRSAHADSSARLVTVSRKAGAALPVLGQRDSKPAMRCSRNAMPL